ncbi:MAG: hypothetical protein HFJ20_02440 [Clostridia bacterium]|nr:hypothetical protein [Clostridia bacterium]
MQRYNKMYKLVINDGVPSFEECDFKGKLEKLLVEKGFEEVDANECVASMYYHIIHISKLKFAF